MFIVLLNCVLFTHDSKDLPNNLFVNLSVSSYFYTTWRMWLYTSVKLLFPSNVPLLQFTAHQWQSGPTTQTWSTTKIPARHVGTAQIQLRSPAAVWPHSQVETWKVRALVLSGLLVQPNSHVHTASNSKVPQWSVTSYCLIQKLTDAFPVEIQSILFTKDKSTPSSNYFWISSDLATIYWFISSIIITLWNKTSAKDTIWTNILNPVNVYIFIYI